MEETSIASMKANSRDDQHPFSYKTLGMSMGLTEPPIEENEDFTLPKVTNMPHVLSFFLSFFLCYLMWIKMDTWYLEMASHASFFYRK